MDEDQDHSTSRLYSFLLKVAKFHSSDEVISCVEALF